MGIAKKEVIYHLHLKNFSRNKGHNFWQGLAYRHGEKYIDEKTGKSFDYRAKAKRENIEYEFIAPDGALEELQDRKKFYDRLHDVSQAKNARYYREFEFALYNDLTKEENKALAKKFGEAISKEYGIFVDLNFHKLDSHNPHCHMVFSERTIVTKEEAEKSKNGRGKTKTQGDLGNKSFKMRNVEFLKDMRKTYADISNEFFKSVGKDIFTSEKSYEERGIDRIPQLHIPKDNEPERQAEVIELNSEIRRRNKHVEFKEKAASLREVSHERVQKVGQAKQNIIDITERLNAKKEKEVTTYNKVNTANVVDFVKYHAKKSGKQRQNAKNVYINKNINTLDDVEKARAFTLDEVKVHFVIHKLRKEARLKEKIDRRQKRREVSKMSEKKFMDMQNDAPNSSRPLDDFEVLMKESTRVSTKAAVKSLKFVGGTLENAFKNQRDHARNFSDRLAEVSDRQRERVNSLRNYKEESYDKFLENRDDRRNKIADKKLDIKAKRLQIRETKKLSIRGARERAKLKNEIRKDKLSIKKQKRAIKRERTVQKALKREYRKEKVKGLAIQKERVKSFLREKQSEFLMKKYKGVKIEKAQGIEQNKEEKKEKIVSIKELREQREKNALSKQDNAIVKDKNKDNVIKIKDKDDFTKIKVNEETMNKIKENISQMSKDKEKNNDKEK